MPLLPKDYIVGPCIFVLRVVGPMHAELVPTFGWPKVTRHNHWIELVGIFFMLLDLLMPSKDNVLLQKKTLLKPQASWTYLQPRSIPLHLVFQCKAYTIWDFGICTARLPDDKGKNEIEQHGTSSGPHNPMEKRSDLQAKNKRWPFILGRLWKRVWVYDRSKGLGTGDKNCFLSRIQCVHCLVLFRPDQSMCNCRKTPLCRWEQLKLLFASCLLSARSIETPRH